MSARSIAGGVVASAVIAIVGWQIGASQVAASTASSSPPSSSGSGSSGSGLSGTQASSAPSASASPSSTPSASPSASTTDITGTFDGTTVETQFGPVQVEIVVSDGKLTDVEALQLTNDGGRSVEISDYAAPILRTEAVTAQSANIQSVSGATYTSEAYITSLQAALDKAGL